MRHITTRKTVLLSLGFLAAVGFSPMMAGEAQAFGLGGGTNADVKAEKEIKELYADFVKAWNKHEVKTIASRWAIDGDHVEPDGTVAKDREGVTALLTAQHEGVFKKSKLELTVKSVWIMSDTVALVDGTYTLSGAQLPDGTAIPAREGMLTSVLLRERNTWSIAASRLMVPMKLPYKSKSPSTAADAAAPIAH